MGAGGAVRVINQLLLTTLLLLAFFSESCTQNETDATTIDEVVVTEVIAPNPDKYVPVRLTADVEALPDNYQQMISILIEAAKIMDELFWYEA